MTISEVSKKYGVTINTLRYYEKIGLLPNVARTTGGIRNYTEEDCGWVEFIKCMRNAGISIEMLIEYVALFQKGEKETREKRKKLLVEQYNQLCGRIEEMQATKKRLEEKIDSYNCLLEVEEELQVDKFKK